MTWGVDYTTRMKSDLVGIEPEVNTALTEFVADWEHNGPPRSNRRAVGSMELFEELVGDRHIVAYIIDDARQRFALLWLRETPLGKRRPLQ